jgi:hypothetical protein
VVIDMRRYFFLNLRERTRLSNRNFFAFARRATGYRSINKTPGLKVRLPSGQEVAKNNLTILIFTHAYPRVLFPIKHCATDETSNDLLCCVPSLLLKRRSCLS